MLGAKWIATVPVFQILAPVGLLQSVQGSIGIIYQAKGRTEWMFRWSLFVLAVTVPAFLIGARFGVVGVAAGYALAVFFVLLYPAFAIPFRLIGLRLRDFASAFVPQLTCTAVMAAGCWFWLVLLGQLGITNAWVRLLSGSAVGAALYISGLLLFPMPVVRYVAEVLESSGNWIALRAAAILQKRAAC